MNIPENLSAKELADLLTLRTCEVESYEDQREKFKNTLVGKILEINPHPNADKLKLCKTDIGGAAVQIVCGGRNLRKDMLVAVALPGARVYWHGRIELTELKETMIRGEKSWGMICAGEEISLPKCPPEEIIDLSHLEVEPGTPLSAALRLDDIVFEIENKSLTHRPDLWGHYGLAREFSVFLNQKLESYEAAAGIKKVKFPSRGVTVKVNIQTDKISPRFCGAIAANIKIAESPEWLRSRLQACGVRPVNNIVDITNFVMLELGQPMHAFDRKLVATDTLDVRWAQNGEVIETIDHKKRRLTGDDAVIDSGKELLGIAGVMGGLNSEISDKTTEVVFEAANWNPVMIRKTSQRHNLRTEAAQRFEKSLDPALAELAILRACELVLKICEGSCLAGPMTDVRLRKPQKISVVLDTAKAIKKIGAQVPRKDIIVYLTRLGFEAEQTEKGFLRITVPAWRATKDVNIEDDIIEEIARMYGYEKIAPELPELPIKLPHENRERKLKHWCRDILALSLGFTETMHYSFYSLTDAKKCLLPEEPHLRIENPLSEDQTHLRINLLPNLLKSAAKNSNFTDEFKVFEIGRQYRKNPGSYFPIEEKMICGIVAEKHGAELKERRGVFFEAKGAVEKFLELFPCLPAVFEDSLPPPPYAHPKKCADVLVREQKSVRVGRVFELNPIVAKKFDIAARIAVFEINFSLLASLPLAEIRYKPLPKFPGINIDISVLTDRQAKNADIERIIKRSDQTLISDVELIDRFEDVKLGEHKKSLTYRVHLCAPGRTLTDEEMTDVQKKIFSSLQKEGYGIKGL